ncbi:MAG: dihydrodipicolinate synthase family protein [Gemmatimonadetes bacterium]|nr:dihydrodipicolinate synthase family protein [Gemmatimonadota bacterium]MBT5055461.1 dihydrodipicolinate synthase family protein [Gemmatimonadota bacterium]MBT5143400.1 dihydrodipicolinate synthase family protein [Gemmatimonadota bacterium]MBT5586666.1 dihydrodipicolinate synthase family protein [Gemmatimonadota bacterium]MBT5963421.1 dihydrodipicolinate synthase family protein [Gemmatimonadota bacterium]
MNVPYHGLWPVMLTAFDDEGALDMAGVDALTEFYIEQGASGLFAVCQSSEMYELSDEERLQLAQRVVERTAGRVPIVAVGTFGGPVAWQAQFIRRMSDTGVNGVVILPNQLVGAEAGEGPLQNALEQLIEATDSIELGLYECPQPFHRNLSPQLLEWAATTARFVYMKDTDRAPDRIQPKIQAVAGSGLRMFNAATISALPSLQMGVAGVSPIAANYYPELFTWLCAHHVDEPAKAEQLQHRLASLDAAVRLKYPQSAKRFLHRRGVPISSRCRVAEHDFDGYDDLLLTSLIVQVDEAKADLGL